jgi:hypothetical protein
MMKKNIEKTKARVSILKRGRLFSSLKYLEVQLRTQREIIPTTRRTI